MTIGLEATRANKKYKTGTEWYAWHLLQQFKKLDHENKFVVYYNNILADALKETPANFVIKNLPWPFKKFWTHMRLSLELIKNPVDKFFASNAVPLLTKGEVIVTIHDLGFFRNPELYHPLERIYQQISHKLAVKKAKKIVTVSEATKKDIKKYFPKYKEEIKVTHLGYNADTFKILEKHEKMQFIDIHDLPDDFFLYIGRLETKKNVANLIKAYKKTNRKWPLVLGGRPGNFGYDEIERLANDPEIKDDIIILGYVSQANYPRLMASARAFVFPSKFEGFGIPLIEAMACKVPILASDIPVFREVAVDSALYFDPDNIDDIAQKMDKITTDEKLQETLAIKGLQRSRQFSWEKCARETLDFILK
ncbi:glycosyltransferase family 4 protein [Candidatus Parcubacteria bacterium]|nr:glycosyltransferase family 4 protein [Candidatus Parcubacteria bacterium]